MSLLDRGRETVTIYHAEQFVSGRDQNILYRASETDVDVVSDCVVQLAAQSGTSARRAEQLDEGYSTEQMYRLRLPRRYTRIIHPASEIEWRGERWYIFGHAKIYNGAPRTAHIDYTIRRS